MDTSGAEKDRLDRVLAELAALREENRRLVARVEALDGGANEGPRGIQTEPSPGSDVQLSRRGVFKLGGAAVGGAALAMAGSSIGASPAAADGPNVLLGNGGDGTGNNAGTAETSIRSSTSFGVATLNALNSSSSAGVGVYGQGTGFSGHSGFAAGVVGDSHDGSGVFGISVNSTGVQGMQTNPSGIKVPTSLGQSTDAPHPAVFGQTNTAPYAVVGTNSAGTALYGCAFGSADPQATEGAPIAAVVGDTNSTSNPALMGRNSNGPQLQLVPSGVARPASGASGELIQDKNNILWLCLGGTTWRKLGGLTTAGQLHVLPSPVRVYDSRLKDGPLAGGAERTVSLTTGTNGTTPAVPAGAIASLFTLTIVRTGAQGFLAAFSNDVSWPGTSNINWFQTNSIDATSVTSAVDSSARIKLHCGGTPTDFVIDVTGYYE